MDDKGAMERVLVGKVRDVPEAVGAGVFVSERTRWMVIRDGTAETIRTLPRSARGLGAMLAEVWAVACDKVESFEKEEQSAWPELY